MKRRSPRSTRPRGADRATSGPPGGMPGVALHGAAEPSAREAAVLTRLAWALAGAFMIALVVVVAGPHSVGDYFTETDFYGAYAQGARLIQHGTLDPSRYGVIGPLYEIVLALAGFVIRDLFVAAETISVVSAGATLLLWFATLARRIGARVALLAVLFMAVNADFFRYGYSATTDAFAMALQALALWLLLARGGRAGTWGAGAVAALAFLTRYNAIYLVPAGLVVLLAAAGPAGRPRRLAAALSFAAGFAIPVLPWVLYAIASGHPFASQLHHNIAYEAFARPQGIVWDDYQKLMQPQFHSLWDVIARDPGAVAARVAFNLLDHLRLDARDLLGWPVAITAGLGLLLALFTGAARRLAPVVLVWALLFLTLVPVFHASRYSLGLLPVYASLAGALFGLPAFALVVGRTRRVWLKPLLAVLPLALALQTSVAAQRETLRMLPREVKPCAETLRALAAPGDRIIARKAHVAYYAGLEAVAFPFADSLSQLADYARANHARWLYVSWPEVQMRPRLAFLLDTAAAVPGLTARRVTIDHPAVVYEIGPGFGARPAWVNDTLLSYHTARAQLMVNGANREALFALAQIEHAWNRFDDAARLLVQLVTLDPRNFGGWLLLGDTALRRGDLETSVRSFNNALRLRPESVAARIGLGWVSLEAGRERDAAAYWRPVIASTTDPITLSRMVRLFRSLGDDVAAGQAAGRLGAQTGGAR